MSKEELKHRFSEHPFSPIQTRFNEIAEGNNLAIFIDDLDRCNVQTTVKVMEGIQNLFKGQRVLYIIAADGKWVSNCFNEQYQNFQNLATLGCSLGDKFLQKCIQLSVNVPKLADNYYQKFGNQIIGLKDLEESFATSAKEQKNSSSHSLVESVEISDTIDQTMITAFESKSQADEVLENKEKYLKKFIKLNYLPTNPRQLKRFMNHYIVMREILRIEGTLKKYDNGDTNEDKSIRFLIFSLEFPTLKDKIRLGYISIDDMLNHDNKSIFKSNEESLTLIEIENIQKLAGKRGNKITDELIRGDFYSL